MKKLILSLTLTIVALFSMSALCNAQVVALEKAKLRDNLYLGLGGGASTPLTLNPVMPLNGNASLRFGKDFSPVFGAFIEGTAWFGDNVGYGHHRCISSAAVTATNVGLNGTINLDNLFSGYKGSPRGFEVVAVAGIGWLHFYSPVAPFDKVDDLSGKTAIDLVWNFGPCKQWQFWVEPGILWDLSYDNTSNRRIHFDRNLAQLGLSAGITYKFKCSNGTHNFKVWNIDSLNSEINRLRAENQKLASRGPVVKEVLKVDTVQVPGIQETWTVGFDQDSAVLTKNAKGYLGKIPAGTKVKVSGSTSPEGSSRRNTELAQERAETVKAFLESLGVEVIEATGGEAGRKAVIEVVK